MKESRVIWPVVAVAFAVAFLLGAAAVSITAVMQETTTPTGSGNITRNLTIGANKTLTIGNNGTMRVGAGATMNVTGASLVGFPSGTGAVDSVNGQTGTVNLTTANMTDSSNKRYVTDAQRTVIQNTSGTNTGDQDLSGLVPNTRQINGQALNANVTLTTNNVASATNNRYVTDAQATVIGNTSGTNTGDQNAVYDIIVGATTVRAASPTQAITLVAGSGISLAGNNTTKSVTINATGAGIGDMVWNATLSATGNLIFGNNTTGFYETTIQFNPSTGVMTIATMNITGTLNLSTQLGVPAGGTGGVTFPDNDIILGNVTGALKSVTAGTGVLTALQVALNAAGGFATINSTAAFTNKTYNGLTVATTNGTLEIDNSTTANVTGGGTFDVGFRNIPQTSSSANYTSVLEDRGKHLFHPASDTNNRTFTINNSVSYAVGTAITVVNQINTLTVALSSGNMTLYDGSGASNTSSTLPAKTAATYVKLATNDWMVTGANVTVP